MPSNSGVPILDAEVEPAPPSDPDKTAEHETCPIEVAFREVDDTLIDLGVGEETRARLAAEGKTISEVYQTGERVVIATRKAIPKVKRLWDKLASFPGFLGKRDMMKRGM